MPGRLPGQVEWTKIMAGAAVAGWIGPPGKVRGVIGWLQGRIAEIRWRSGVEAEKVIGGMDWEGGNPLIWWLMNRWSGREQYTSIANLILEGGEGEEEKSSRGSDTVFEICLYSKIFPQVRKYFPAWNSFFAIHILKIC